MVNEWLTQPGPPPAAAADWPAVILVSLAPPSARPG